MVYVTASLIEPHGLFSYIFLSPLFWVLLAFVWVLTFGDSMRQPPIHKPYSKYVRPGDFVYDDEKEKTYARKRAGTPEHAIYAALERKRGLSGVKILREGTQIIIRKEEGKVGTERVTPAAIVYPRGYGKQPVAVFYDRDIDHGFYRGSSITTQGAHIYRDADVTQRVAENGFAVVRVRAGAGYFVDEVSIYGSRNMRNGAAITPGTDVVLDHEYRDNTDRSAVTRAVLTAKHLPRHTWEVTTTATWKYHNVEVQQQELDRKKRAMERQFWNQRGM